MMRRWERTAEKRASRTRFTGLEMAGAHKAPAILPIIRNLLGEDLVHDLHAALLAVLQGVRVDIEGHCRFRVPENSAYGLHVDVAVRG